ncbi:transglycosylase domain-containing protein [Sediminibacterium sp.]|uniref:transglycosylase domain-containing protein n=1 Tax=Sediminibacterium sp. TaxID=1917865 RepID=UPI002735D6FA|nr:transglycosylase domain-containing protein [Sediminibacterium sp.]MDP3392839.1 transglycosylase domain-containing protein [Sediminibacterium sp.]MDP3565961.1 transglycosylase domain-containing protein [Sediminibacterium sp.]
MTKPVRIFWRIFFGGFAFVIILLAMLNFGWIGSMPDLDDIENPSASLASQVYAEDGTLMGKYYIEDRINVHYKDISKHIIEALIATEDERFYAHSGIDARSLGRAIFYLGSEGGASTITMQTAKNLFTENWSTKNFILRALQKIKEGIIAVKLERNFTKEEIITLYLNTVAYSDNVFGIRNASKTFFQKEPDRVNVEEAAVLIGMLKGATLYNPRRNPKLSLDRRNTVLSQMVRNNYLDAQQAEILKRQPIELNYKKLDETTGLGPYFRMILGEEMKKWCKENTKNNGDQYDLYRDGLKIYTTINPRMQLYAEEAVAKHMSYMQKLFNTQENIRTGSIWKGFETNLDQAIKQTDRWKNLKREGLTDEENLRTFYQKVPMRVFAWNNNRGIDTTMTPFDSIKYHKQMLQAGFMVMDPLNGQIKAWVGGIDFKTFKYDHANINTKRQVGSTIKPLLYSLAIEEAGLNPNSPVQDIQQNFGQYGLVPATSKTCTGATIPMAIALAKSRNCASAYIMKQLDNTANNGAKRFVEFLEKCELKTKIEPYPSIALGACEISLFEMMQAYSMFPGRGFNAKPMYITRIEDRNGNVLATFTPQRKEVINDVTAYSVIKMMQGVLTNGTGAGIWGHGIPSGLQVAGKTGTTNNNSDAWFMGYTPQYLAGGWVGCDDRFIRFNSKNGEGGRAAMPIWAYFFNKAIADPNCGIDTKLSFIKPEVMSNDIIIDYINGTNPILGGEGEDMGTGTSEDYEIPKNIKPEELGAESDIIIENKKPATPPATPGSNTNKPADKPKAVLPPPVKKPGGNK